MTRMMLVSALSVMAVLLPACGGSDEESAPELREKLNRSGEVTAICTEPNGTPHAMMGAGPRNWREMAIVAGPVGVQNRIPPLSAMTPDSGPGLVTKMPILVAGHRTVRVRPAGDSIGRIGFYFGPERSFSDGHGARSVLFRPCSIRSSSGFPGGIRVVGSEPVTLLVESADGKRNWRLPLGRPRTLGMAN